MSVDALSGSDKSTPEDSGDTPFMVKWGLTNASPVYVLYESMVKWYNDNNNYISQRIENREMVKGLLTTFSTIYGQVVATHLWIHGATTTDELITEYKISKQTINNNLSKLERLGFIHKTAEVVRYKGSSGQISWIYALTIADDQASIDAQLRYTEIKKREDRKKRERRKDRKRLAAEEIRRRAEVRDLLKDTVIQTLVSSFTGLYEKSKKPVPFAEITQSAKSVGLDDPLVYIDVAAALEDKGIQTGYYINGELDPTAKLPPKILESRIRWEENL